MNPGWDLGLETFADVGVFYAMRGGERSGESDFGVWWYDDEQAWSGCWRVSAVEATGDVYAVLERPRTRNERRGKVVLLGNLGGPDLGYTKAHAALEGWEQICGAADSLSWVLDRVRLVTGQIAAVEAPHVSEEAAIARLREWSRDELHLTQSARMHEPVYANPAALRADVRTLLALLGPAGVAAPPDPV